MPDSPDLAGRRLLLVEDEYMLASELAGALADLGAEVVGPVGSVADALSLIEEAGALDAAVLDVNLAGERVYPVADRLNERGVPFVFATGYDARVLAPDYTGHPRCEKPVDIRALASLLSERIWAQGRDV